MLLRLDAFGHDAHVEVAGEREDRLHDSGGLVVAQDIGDEGAVDLQLVEGEVRR